MSRSKSTISQMMTVGRSSARRSDRRTAATAIRVTVPPCGGISDEDQNGSVR
ncbi:hypothetical protein [Roseovarius sp. D22-M7]|uniref:hypothetical protein n=1 Tax=Roseovarius sp. D22-M7 TaxID=3127116 RepID=UPI00300FB25E